MASTSTASTASTASTSTASKGKKAVKAVAPPTDDIVDTPSVAELVSALTKRVEELETIVNTLKADASKQGGKPEKEAKAEKKPRAPTAYNIFMKTKMVELKEQQPEMSNIDRMKMAAEAWSESKK